MALSMDEQRMLAEIERRLAAEDPVLAARLSAFRRPSRVNVFRSGRARVVGSLLIVTVVAMVSLMVYAILPFRSGSRTSGHAVTTVSTTGTGQPKIGAGPGTKTTGKNSTGKNTTSKSTGTSAAKSASTAAPAPAKSPAASGRTAARTASGSTASRSTASRSTASGSTASGSTAKQTSSSRSSGAAVHQADGSPGTTSQRASATVGQSP